MIAQRIPLRPLFIITSAFLFAMGIKFIGEAVQEFQEQALISVTEVKGSNFLSAIGLNPSVEALSIQLLVILVALASYSVYQRNNRLAREAKANQAARG
jgi:high-affinity iron transporter